MHRVSLRGIGKIERADFEERWRPRDVIVLAEDNIRNLFRKSSARAETLVTQRPKFELRLASGRGFPLPSRCGGGKRGNAAPLPNANKLSPFGIVCTRKRDYSAMPNARRRGYALGSPATKMAADAASMRAAGDSPSAAPTYLLRANSLRRIHFAP